MATAKDHLLKSLAAGLRYDGRSLLEFRPIAIEIDVSKSAEGSARVRFGQTDVIAGIKMGTDTPYPDTPDQGNLMVNAELLALSSPEFEPGPPSEQATELARVVDRGIRESHAIDLKKLCIASGEAAWSVLIDVCTINDDGGLLDASALAALAALKVARFPKYKDGVVDYMTRTETRVPLQAEPVAITVFKIGDHFLVDPLPEEEKLMDARLTAAITADGTVCALQKGGSTPLSIEDIDRMVEIAEEKATQLREAVDKAVRGR
jgi:exosome complex component RRP42